MTKTEAVACAIAQMDKEGIPIEAHVVRERALKLLESSKVDNQSAYNSLGNKRVKMHMKPIFKEQHSIIKELAASSAAEFMGYEIWRLFKTQKEKDAAVIVYNKIREKVTRGFVEG